MVKNLPADAGGAGDMGLIPRSGRSPGSPLQYGNSKDRGAWWATVHRVTKSQTQPSMHAHKSIHLYPFICQWTLGCFHV